MGLKTNAKRIIKAVDARFFKSYFTAKYSKFKLLHGEELYNIRSKYNRRFHNGKKLKVIAARKIPVNDLLLSQYHGGDFSSYRHYDGAVRMLAIEEYYNKNNIGFDLYRRMQIKSGFDWTERFKTLISSYEKEGYKKDSYIEVDEHLQIMDGSHRLTLAAYNGQEFINALIYGCDRERSFNYDFFWQNGFTPDECSVIKRKTDEILKNANYSFVGVLWPPAKKYFDNIIEDMKKFDPQHISIIDIEDRVMERSDFVHMFKGLYHTDILDDHGMDQKIALIENCMPTDSKEYPIRIFTIKIDQPKIAINPKNYMPQSLEIKRIKTVFRNRYKDKIPGYKYDVIMHISDNYLQSVFCKKLLALERDVSEFFKKINSIPYAIIKLAGRQSANFPYYYYFSDVDIIVRKEDKKKIAHVAETYLKEKYNIDWFEVKKTCRNGGIEYWLRLLDFAIFSIHVQTTEYFAMKYEFNEKCLENRIYDNEKNIYFLPIKYDILFRSIELIKKPYKIWHKYYIENHLSDIDDRLLSEAFDKHSKMALKIKQLWNQLRSQQDV